LTNSRNIFFRYYFLFIKFNKLINKKSQKQQQTLASKVVGRRAVARRVVLLGHVGVRTGVAFGQVTEGGVVGCL
jgi:hypothetical protein